MIAYHDHIESLPPQAFPPRDLGKLTIPESDPLGLTWRRYGTQLRATTKLSGGIDHLVEVDTAMSGDELDPAATSVGIFTADNRFVEEVDEMVRYYDVLRDAANAEVERRAMELIEAHEEERDEQRAERARDEEGMYA